DVRDVACRRFTTLLNHLKTRLAPVDGFDKSLPEFGSQLFATPRPIGRKHGLDAVINPGTQRRLILTPFQGRKLRFERALLLFGGALELVAQLISDSRQPLGDLVGINATLIVTCA